MSFRQGARQFFERRVAPTPPLPYDAEVEYLESTGTQWIDTGIYGDDNLFASVSCMATGQSANVRDVVGANDTSRDVFGYSFRIRIIRNSIVKYSIGRNTTSSYTATVDSVVIWHDVTIDTTSGAKKIFIDGIQFGTTLTSTANKMATKVYLFAQNNDGVANDFADGVRVSAFSVKDTTTGRMLLDLIPVRFTNELGESEGAMYDRVSGALFRNAGTGAFTIGPDK